jgi:hypothetical protein
LVFLIGLYLGENESQNFDLSINKKRN